MRRLAVDASLITHAACRAPTSAPYRCHVIGNLGPDTDWRDALHGIDVVVHVAGQAHVMDRRSLDARRFDRVNHLASVRLAHEAARIGVRRLVFVSSIAVHGVNELENTAITPETPVRPKTAYAASKARAEHALGGVAASTGIELVIIRPPLVHGPSAPGNLGRLARLVRAGVPLPIGLADNQRSVVSQENLSSLIHCCIRHPSASGRVFLAADRRDLSTPELVQAIAAGIGVSARIANVPKRIARPVVRAVAGASTAAQLFGSLRVDASATTATLGWIPRGDPALSITEGLREASG
jgi:nucleoside-diphosphate-sugar epimerase